MFWFPDEFEHEATEARMYQRDALLQSHQPYDNYSLKSPPSMAPEEAAMSYFTPC